MRATTGVNYRVFRGSRRRWIRGRSFVRIVREGFMRGNPEWLGAGRLERFDCKIDSACDGLCQG